MLTVAKSTIASYINVKNNNMVLASNGLCLCGFTLHQTTSKLNREIGS